MEILLKEPLFSRQGKASKHAHPNLFTSPQKSPKPKMIQPQPFPNIKKILLDLQNQRKIQTQAQKSRIKPTSSFKAVSRQQHQFAFRNRTCSPKVGTYSPKNQVISPRINLAPKIITHSSVPKQKKLLLASCVDNKLNCSFPRKNLVKNQKFDQKLKRVVHTTSEYEEKKDLKESQWSPIPEKQAFHVKSPVKFCLQRKRHPFILSSDPPNEKRFDFVYPTSFVISSNKRVITTDVEKLTKRGELFALGLSLDCYDRNQEVTIPKLSRIVPNFQKQEGRRGLSLDHIVKNQASPDLSKLDHAMNQQSKYRGAVNIPLMGLQTSRDDSMYRTIQMYNLNVPEKQDAVSVPKFMGDYTSEFLLRTRMVSNLSYFADSIK